MPPDAINIPLGQQLSFLLKTSRPGLWFPTIWLYLLPFTSTTIPWDTPFLLGLFFCTLPLNLLIYAWNDWADVDVDKDNPRKDSFLFGGRGNREQLRLPLRAAIVGQCVFWPVFVYHASVFILLPLGMTLLTCYLYNRKQKGWRNVAGWDVIAQAGYLSTVVLSCELNDAPFPAATIWLYLLLFCAQSHLIGEVMDIEPDKEAGRQTTAVVLGRTYSKWLIITIVLCEVLLLALVFEDLLFAGSLGLFLLWLLLDVLVLFPNKNYNRWQFTLFGIGANIAAAGSMAYVLHSGIFAPAM